MTRNWTLPPNPCLDIMGVEQGDFNREEVEVADFLGLDSLLEVDSLEMEDI